VQHSTIAHVAAGKMVVDEISSLDSRFGNSGENSGRTGEVHRVSFIFYRPAGTGSCFLRLPSACVLGCILSPLCGWRKRGNRRDVHRLFPSMSRQQKNGERPVCPRFAAHIRIHLRGYTGPAAAIEIAYFAPGTGPMTKMVLPDGSSKSNVLAPHSSFFGGRKASTFELHSR
jgi:hypothetical protein